MLMRPVLLARDLERFLRGTLLVLLPDKGTLTPANDGSHTQYASPIRASNYCARPIGVSSDGVRTSASVCGMISIR